MPTVSPGMRLHDRFVLVERIGMGGMSQVWRATDEVLGRPVAVKMLTAELAADPALQEATWREARAAARLTHPNVTRVYDYGEAPLPGGARAPYLVMELVEGQSLADRLTSGPLPWREAAGVGAQVAAALAAAHQVGVVHHDVKPGNVMITPDGAKVLDFGIAALVGAADQQMLVGTPTYAAPERLRRAPAHPANDIYSLGVLLHECLSGRPPARMADWSEAVAMHRAGPAPAPALPGVPSELADLVGSCLSPDPAQRPEARQVGARLATAAGVPDPTAAIAAEAPTVATPLRYAVGSAAPAAAPRTRIDHQESSVAAPGGRGRLMLAGVTVGVVVLALVIALVIAALHRGGLQDAAGPGTAPHSPASATGPTSPATATSPPAPTPDRTADVDADVDRGLDIVRDLEGQINDGLRDGLIDRDAANDLRDELRELEDELTDPDYDRDKRIEEVRKAARDFEEELEDLLDDREIRQPLANSLQRTLRPLLTFGNG